MATQKFARILYFTAGPVPTIDERADAEEFGPGVAFRNARAYSAGSQIEKATYIAGAAPAAYSAVYGEAPRNFKRVGISPADLPASPPSEALSQANNEELSAQAGQGQARRSLPQSRNASTGAPERRDRNLRRRNQTPVDFIGRPGSADDQFEDTGPDAEAGRRAFEASHDSHVGPTEGAPPPVGQPNPDPVREARNVGDGQTPADAAWGTQPVAAQTRQPGDPVQEPVRPQQDGQPPQPQPGTVAPPAPNPNPAGDGAQAAWGAPPSPQAQAQQDAAAANPAPAWPAPDGTAPGTPAPQGGWPDPNAAGQKPALPPNDSSAKPSDWKPN